MTLGVEPGKKIITTPITFAATANCVQYCSGEVDFVDIDPETYLIDLKSLQYKLESSPKGTYSGIIPVDFTGYPVDMESVRKLADELDIHPSIIAGRIRKDTKNYKILNQLVGHGEVKRLFFST